MWKLSCRAVFSRLRATAVGRAVPVAVVCAAGGSTLFACSTDEAAVALTETPASGPVASAIHERALAQDSQLRAHIGATVVLDLEAKGAAASNDTGTIGVDVVPYP